MSKNKKRHHIHMPDIESTVDIYTKGQLSNCYGGYAREFLSGKDCLTAEEYYDAYTSNDTVVSNDQAVIFLHDMVKYAENDTTASNDRVLQVARYLCNMIKCTTYNYDVAAARYLLGRVSHLKFRQICDGSFRSHRIMISEGEIYIEVRDRNGRYMHFRNNLEAVKYIVKRFDQINIMYHFGTVDFDDYYDYDESDLPDYD